MPAATSDSALITVLRLIPDAAATARLATATKHLCRRARHHPALHLVHVGQDHFEESREPLVSDLHTARILRAF